jgi:hypothetical protein
MDTCRFLRELLLHCDKIGLSFGFAFVGGHLQTEDCPLNQLIAACGSNPVIKLWDWNGTDFFRI